MNTSSLLNSFVGGASNLMGDKKSFAKGAAAGGLAGLLLGGKKTRKIAKSAAKFGGAALVGGLALKAYQNYKASGSVTGSNSGSDVGGASPAAGTVPATQPESQPYPQPQREQIPHASHSQPSVDFFAAVPNTSLPDADQLMILKAMVAAAKADGHIDAAEKNKIAAELAKMDIAAEDQAFINAELAKPQDVNTIADLVETEEQAAEVYMASLLVIDETNRAEEAYLGLLSARLNLDDALVSEIHQAVRAIEA